jgi:hypothetical protein
MLGHTGGNKREAAERLGISYKAILYKIREFGIGRPRGPRRPPAPAARAAASAASGETSTTDAPSESAVVVETTPETFRGDDEGSASSYSD